MQIHFYIALVASRSFYNRTDVSALALFSAQPQIIETSEAMWEFIFMCGANNLMNFIQSSNNVKYISLLRFTMKLLGGCFCITRDREWEMISCEDGEEKISFFRSATSTRIRFYWPQFPFQERFMCFVLLDTVKCPVRKIWFYGLMNISVMAFIVKQCGIWRRTSFKIRINLKDRNIFFYLWKFLMRFDENNIFQYYWLKLVMLKLDFLHF